MIGLARRIQLFHGKKFIADPVWKDRLEEVGIAPDRDWSQVSGGRLVSVSPIVSCFQISLGDGETIYFKRYVYPLTTGVKFWMRPGKAAVEVWAYNRLCMLGVPCPQVLAFGEQRVLGMLKATFIVTRGVPASQELARFALETWYTLPEGARRQLYREISGQLVDQVRTAHQGRFFHHDLKWRNILVCTERDRYSTVWIDAPRASMMLFRRRRGVVVDLSGLARLAVSLLSKYDRMRFICRYLGAARKPGDAKRLYWEVAANLSRRPPEPLILPPRESR